MLDKTSILLMVILDETSPTKKVEVDSASILHLQNSDVVYFRCCSHPNPEDNTGSTSSRVCSLR